MGRPWPIHDPSQQHRLSTDVHINAGLQSAVLNDVYVSSEYRFEQLLEIRETE